MARHINTIGMTLDDVISVVQENFNILEQNPSNWPGSAPFTTVTVTSITDDLSQDTDNLVWDIYYPYYSRFASNKTVANLDVVKARMGFKFEKNDDARVCIVKAKMTPFRFYRYITGATEEQKTLTIDCWLILASNTSSSTSNMGTLSSRYVYIGTPSYPYVHKDVNTWTGPNTGHTHSIGTNGQITNFNNTLITNFAFRRISPVSIIDNYFDYTKSSGAIYRPLTDDHLSSLHSIYNSVVTMSGLNMFVNGADNNYTLIDGFLNSICNAYGFTVASPVRFPENVPIFDLDDGAVNIVKYLTTGEIEGNIDPFDPSNPEVTEITDYKTNFRLYMSVNSANKTLNDYQMFYINNQYVNNSDILAGNYTAYLQPFGYEPLPRPYKSQAQQLVINWTDFNAWNSSVGNRQKIYMCYFGDNELGVEDGNSSGAFKIWFKGNEKSEFGQSIEKVEFFAHWYDGSPTATLSKVAITDGYRYTAPTGETLDIYFRSAGSDDYKDSFDPGYREPDDEDDDKSGDLPGLVVGNGLKTYKLSESAFRAVNEALWTTDWSTVFKSQTIDPIKSVISCKGIPFDMTGAGADTVYLANRDINIGAGVTINPIGKFDVGTYTIEPINGNFIDMVYAKVRVYLPFIGWIELPADEVISRQSNLNTGIVGKAHTLGFYYLVDFVDGTCRCVVSCDRTERWYFDGNCSIDIPVTSDNHTTAIANSIKSGVSTVMSIASIAAGAATGNAGVAGGGVIGLAQNAPNVIPTYEFSATASSSGYINNAMNKHIMIVIEYPNAYYPSGYNHKYGLPCMLSKSLGSLKGFTKTFNAEIRNVNCTQEESNLIASLLNEGVYL